jgi:hypothetical protein
LAKKEGEFGLRLNRRPRLKFMKKHLLKLAILIPGLAFLIWWGWIGNFSFKSGSFYPFEPQEDYYNLVAGQAKLGYVRRQVTREEGTKNLILTEEAVINISLAVAKGEVRPYSRAVFAPNGAILESALNLTLKPGERPLAEVIGRIENGQLHYKFNVGTTAREMTLPVPEEGPILISGLIPWLAHQRDLPLGRPIFFNIFDTSSLDFRPASLTIIDVTAQDVEKKIYKLAVLIDPNQTELWIDADGHMLNQRVAGLDAGLDLLTNPASVETAKKALNAPPKPGFLQHIPQGILDMLINQGVGTLWPSSVPKK